MYRRCVDVAGVAIQIAAQASSQAVPFSGPVIEAVLKDVLDLQDEQVARLEAVEGGVQRLLDGPWKAGRLRLDEAALPGRPLEARRALLTGAADAFRDAIALQPDPSWRRAQACLDLAMTLALLGDRPGEQHYAVQGYLSARETLWVLTNGDQAPRRKREWESNPKSRRAFDDGYVRHLDAASRWFDDFQLIASAFADPDAQPAYPSEDSTIEEFLAWRQGALLDHHYLTRRRERYGADRAAHHWEFFSGEPKEIVATPRWPEIQSMEPFKDVVFERQRKLDAQAGYSTPYD